MFRRQQQHNREVKESEELEALQKEVEVSGEKVAEMMIVGRSYHHTVARELREVAEIKIIEIEVVGLPLP